MIKLAISIKRVNAHPALAEYMGIIGMNMLKDNVAYKSTVISFSIKQHTVFALLISASPLFFVEIGGLASAKDHLLMLNLPPEVTKTHTFPLAVSAN